MCDHDVYEVPRTAEVNVDVRSLFGFSVKISGFSDGCATDEVDVLHKRFNNIVVSSDDGTAFHKTARQEMRAVVGKGAAYAN